MAKSTKSNRSEIETIRGQVAPEVALWSLVLILGAFSAYGMLNLLWGVNPVAYVFCAMLFLAISIATPLMVMRAERAKGSNMVFAFSLAAMLALGDWIGGYNGGVQIEKMYMSQTWTDGQEAHDTRVATAMKELKDAKQNLQVAIVARTALTPPDTSSMGPQNTASETAKFEASVRAADGLIALAKDAKSDASKTVERLPSEYVKPKLFSHTLLGVFMAALQFITLSGFIVCGRIKRAQIAEIESDKEAFDKEVAKLVNRKVGQLKRQTPSRNKTGNTPKPKVVETEGGQKIYLTAT